MKSTMSKALMVFAGSLGMICSAEATPVQVDIYGTVAFNGISAPPLGTVGSGQTAHIAFEVDSTNFVDSIPGDVRAYAVNLASFSMSFSGGVSMPLLGGPAYFAVIDGFPVSDGFFLSSSTTSPGGVGLAQTPYQANFSVGYTGSTLSSLDILAAVGTYNFSGLTSFGYNLWSIIPDNVVMDINFDHMTIAAVPAPATLLAFMPLGYGIGRRRRG